MRAITATVLALLLTACGDDPAPTPAVKVPSWAKVAPEQIAEAKKHGVPVAFENDLGMRFVLIPAGTFLMGSPVDEEGRDDDETLHEVTISKPFYMQITEVTNAQYCTFKPDHESGAYHEHSFEGSCQPVVRVSWPDAKAFSERLSEQGIRAYRLPSEAEWEHACRAGTHTSRFWGEDSRLAPEYANCADKNALPYVLGFDQVRDSLNQDDGAALTARAGSYRPNPWGLYDMIGNVWEWCRDWYEPYPSSAAVDPIGPPSGAERVVRGGSWAFPPPYSTSHARLPTRPSFRPETVGLRLVSPLPEPGERGR